MPKYNPITIEIVFKDMVIKQSGMTLKKASEWINEKVKDIYGFDINLNTQLVYNLKRGKDISPIIKQIVKVYEDVAKV